MTQRGLCLPIAGNNAGDRTEVQRSVKARYEFMSNKRDAAVLADTEEHAWANCREGRRRNVKPEDFPRAPWLIHASTGKALAKDNEVAAGKG